MKVNKNYRHSMHRLRRKIKLFFDKALLNKKDAVIAPDANPQRNEDIYRMDHESLKVY